MRSITRLKVARAVSWSAVATILVWLAMSFVYGQFVDLFPPETSRPEEMREAGGMRLFILIPLVAGFLWGWLDE